MAGGAERPSARRDQSRSGPPRRWRHSVVDKGSPECGVCGDGSSRTVLIAVGGLILMKDLCSAHLAALLQGARESP